MSNPLDPKKAINSLEAWREAQTDIVNSVLSAWLPKPPHAGASEPDAPPSISKARGPVSQEANTDLSSEVELLKQQVAEMQARLENLQDK